MEKYAAFISYRHKPADIAAAKAIHTALETYRIPAPIRKQTGRKKVGRCFRDREELPTSSDLAQDIITALEQSDWLIAVCTPDTPKSKWCISEIETFIKLHGRSRVIAVLVDGEPEESVPEILRYETLADGTRVEREPLAADLRTDGAGALKRRVRVEKLRLLAPMLEVSFDDLKRRARERAFKVAISSSAAVAAFFALFGGYMFRQAAVISRQNIEIAQRNEDLAAQMAETERQRERAEANAAEAVRHAGISMENEIQLLISRSLSDSENGNNFEAAQKALDAYIRYQELHPSGNAMIREQIFQALSSCVYSQPYQLVQNIHNENRLLWDLSFSPDGRHVIGITGSGTVLIDAANGAILSSRAHASMVNAVQFSRCGTYFLAAEYWTNRVYVFRTDDPARDIASFVQASEWPHDLRGAVFSPEGSIVISSAESGLIDWDFLEDFARPVASGDTLRGTMMSVGAVLSPDGSLAVCPLDFQADTVSVIEVESGRRLHYPMPVRLGGRVFAFSPDGSQLAGAFVRTIVIWDTATQEVLHMFEANTRAISGLSFSPDGRIIAATSEEGVMMFLTSGGKALYTFGVINLDYGFILFGVAFSPSSREAVVYGNTAQVYDLADGRLISSLGGNRAISAAFSHDGRYLALVTAEGNAGLYSTSVSASAVRGRELSGELYVYPQWFEAYSSSVSLQRTHSYERSIYSFASEQMANSHSGRFIAVTYPDGYVEVWDLDRGDGRSSYLLREHMGLITHTRMTDRYLITAGYDGRIMVFDLVEGATVHFISVGERIPRFEVSQDGEMIIVLTESGANAQVYALRSGSRIYSLEAEAGSRVSDIGFTADGSYAVIVQNNGRVVSGRLLGGFDELLEQARALLPA